MERNESCHFGHPPGALIKGKIGPRRKQIYLTADCLTLLNRRPIALSSLFCKCPKVKIIIRHLLQTCTDWAKRVYRRSFCECCTCTYLAASVHVEQTHPTGQLLGVLDAVPQNAEGEI